MRKRAAFTLIELLVVIAVIALLMAILLPCLQRAMRQAKAVVCQSNLKQMGTIWATYASENDGLLPDGDLSSAVVLRWDWVWGSGYGPYGDPALATSTERMRCCPMATKLANPSGIDDPDTDMRNSAGGTFLAWGRFFPEGLVRWDTYGSYGSNPWVLGYYHLDARDPRPWRTLAVKVPSDIP
ncbi:MAG: prepilin-type N-terminal cleavage/methylation domain-containing protein, partial [Phycisphaerales bacterium]